MSDFAKKLTILIDYNYVIIPLFDQKINTLQRKLPFTRKKAPVTRNLLYEL